MAAVLTVLNAENATTSHAVEFWAPLGRKIVASSVNLIYMNPVRDNSQLFSFRVILGI